MTIVGTTYTGNGTAGIITNSNTGTSFLEPHIGLRGTPIIARLNILDEEMKSLIDPDTAIKQRLVELLAKEIWNSKCVEFTKELDDLNGNHICRARIYAVPDDQVRLLRKNNTSYG